MAFQCSPFTGKFFERSGHKYQLADMVGFLVFLIGELTKKSCFLFGVVFAILLANLKQANVMTAKITYKQCGTD